MRNAKSSARKKSPKTRIELEFLATQTAAALARALREIGVSAGALADAFRDAPGASAPALKRLGTGTDSAQLGTMLALWHRDRRFTDSATGLPAPLAREGRTRSMRALMRAAGIRTAHDEWTTFLIKSNLLRRVNRNQYLPKGRSARMPSLNPLHAEHISLGIYHLIRTAAKNYTANGLTRPLLQGAAVVRDFPKREEEAFRKFVNAQGDAFLANVDDFLESRATMGRMSKATLPRRARAGVYAFAFTE